jgi:hypothetical protein
MINKNLINKLTAQKSASIKGAGSHGGNSKASLTIVNSRHNGKRMMLSKALKEALGIEQSFTVASFPEDGCILMGKELPNSNDKFNMSPSDNQICYSSTLINYLVKAFNLDYENVTSRSFSEIQIDTSGDTPIAIIKLSEPTITDEEDTEESA